MAAQRLHAPPGLAAWAGTYVQHATLLLATKPSAPGASCMWRGHGAGALAKVQGFPQLTLLWPAKPHSGGRGRASSSSAASQRGQTTASSGRTAAGTRICGQRRHRRHHAAGCQAWRAASPLPFCIVSAFTADSHSKNISSSFPSTPRRSFLGLPRTQQHHNHGGREGARSEQCEACAGSPGGPKTARSLGSVGVAVHHGLLATLTRPYPNAAV
jgi:hypothetical protein